MFGLGSGGTEPKGKRTHEHGQQCVDCKGEESIRGINGNGKNTTVKESQNERTY